MNVLVSPALPASIAMGAKIETKRILNVIAEERTKMTNTEQQKTCPTCSRNIKNTYCFLDNEPINPNNLCYRDYCADHKVKEVKSND